jgi:hypothetical protein
VEKIVAVTAALTGTAVPSGLILHTAGVERGVNAQIATQLDAGVGARNVEETGTIRRADSHILDRFGLDGKISRLCPPMASRPAAEPRTRLLIVFILASKLQEGSRSAGCLHT